MKYEKWQLLENAIKPKDEQLQERTTTETNWIWDEPGTSNSHTRIYCNRIKRDYLPFKIYLIIMMDFE